MYSPNMRRDPKTGALIFSTSPEVKELQGLRGDIQTLIACVTALTSQVGILAAMIQDNTNQNRRNDDG